MNAKLSHPALNTLILHTGKREFDGTMYSCTFGVKIGGGIGTAVVGWSLEFSGYIEQMQLSRSLHLI